MDDITTKISNEDASEQENLPFYNLYDDQDLRQQYGFPQRPLHDFEFKNHTNRQVFHAPLPGNFFSGKIMRDLRITTGHRLKSVKKRPSLDLTLILDLPLELILEILKHLHPIDLHHLVQTSRALHQFLLTRKLEMLWQTVYDRNPTIPSCLEGISIPRWTSLLFGEPICEECNIDRGMLNFYLRRRLCERCTLDLCLTSLSTEEQISHTNPELSETFMTVLRPVELHPGRVYASSDSCTVWHLEAEVFEKKEILIKLAAAAKGGREDAVIALERFESDCGAVASRLLQDARRCTQWATDIIQSIDSKSNQSIYIFASRSIPLLIALNHDPRDTRQNAIEYALTPYRPLRFSKRNFRHFLPVIEAELAVRKARRLERERKRLVSKRMEAVSDLWADYRFDRHPGDCASYQPTDDVVSDYGLFQYYINDPSTSFEELGRERAYDEFSHLVSEWEEDCKRRLVLAWQNRPYVRSSRFQDADLLTPENLSRMQLAMSVYTCMTCKSKSLTKTDPGSGSLLLGLSEAMLHMKCMFGTTSSADSFEKSYRGSAVVRSLLELLDLDPNMTLRRDLDRLDARFVCMNCFDICQKSGSGLVNTHIWRECIVHELSHQHESPCEWALLSAEATRSIRLVEEVWPSPDEYMWYCLHCPEFYLHPSRFDTVAIHVETSHRIVVPTLDVDVGYVLETASNTRQLFGIAPDETYRCLLCSGLDRLELRKHDNLVFDHFPEFHSDITSPEKHIEQIELLERVSPRSSKYGRMPVCEFSS